MSVLPKLLYYFQTPPLPLSNRFFDKLNKLFGQFIWIMEKLDLSLLIKLLYLPYERGGLQLPNLKWYYMASQLTAASYYFYTAVPPAWVNIEQESIPDLPLKLYLYSSDINTLKSTQKIHISKIQFQYGMLHISMWVTCQHCLNSCLFDTVHTR